MNQKRTRPTSAAQWELYHPETVKSHVAAAALTEALKAAERALYEGKVAGVSAEVRAEIAVETIVAPVAKKYAGTGALDTEPIANAASWLIYFIEHGLKPDPVGGKVLLWKSRIANVFRGGQDCVHVVDITEDDDGPCLAVVRTMDDAKLVAAALRPGAEIITE